MEREDILIFVDNIRGNDVHDGIHQPVKTADRAFSLLPPYWRGRAEIIFAVTDIEYPVTASAVYLGTPIGPDASPLVIRGGYLDDFVVRATGGTGDNVITTSDIPADSLIGAVLTRLTGGGSPVGTAISIRGNAPGVNAPIALQRTIGPVVSGDTFKVQKPAVTLALAETLSLTSHDARSPNCTLIGIKVEPAPGAGLNLLNVRALCDTCDFSLHRSSDREPKSATLYIHTNSRIQGGSEEQDDLRAQAGVYIHGDHPSHVVWAVRDGVLAGHLTFKTITVRVSQGGVFIPRSLEALAAPIQILTGGSAMGQPSWGTAANKARIRNVAGPAGDGLRVFNGGALNSPLAPIHLDIYGCNRDGIRLDMNSSASFGMPGRDAGLVTTDATNLNRGFGMNIRNASRALVGTDANITPLTGLQGDAGLDDGRVRTDRFTWNSVVGSPSAVPPVAPVTHSNDRLSLVCVNL